MRLAVILGTRPEIVKMAPVIRAADDRGVECVVIHTGQHYSFEMDGIFFDELQLRPPDVNLAVGSGSHAYQIAGIISPLERVLLDLAPDAVLVEGDTNSVLAAGLTANKVGQRVAHIEAGLRSNERSMPEEINRILVDHLADDLFAPTATAIGNLLREGVPSHRIVLSGNTVVDEVLRQRETAHARGVPERMGLTDRGFILATIHRAENVNNATRLQGILEGLGRTAQALKLPILASLHPRTANRIKELGLEVDPAIRVLPPLGYLEFLNLHSAAALILTDSGGLQEEACTLEVPCVTLRDNTERPEALAVGASLLAGAAPDAIVAAACAMIDADRDWRNPFGDGHSGERIVDWLVAPQAAARVPFTVEPASKPVVLPPQPAQEGSSPDRTTA